MNDIEVQTEEIEEPGPNPAEEDLIRLQSSMCEIQEDFTRERQMLKDQIAHLQVQLLFSPKRVTRVKDTFKGFPKYADYETDVVCDL